MCRAAREVVEGHRDEGARRRGAARLTLGGGSRLTVTDLEAVVGGVGVGSGEGAAVVGEFSGSGADCGSGPGSDPPAHSIELDRTPSTTAQTCLPGNPK